VIGGKQCLWVFRLLRIRRINAESSRTSQRNELHARIGRLRSEAETMSFVDLSRFLAVSPVSHHDHSLSD